MRWPKQSPGREKALDVVATAFTCTMLPRWAGVIVIGVWGLLWLAYFVLDVWGERIAAQERAIHDSSASPTEPK